MPKITAVVHTRVFGLAEYMDAPDGKSRIPKFQSEMDITDDLPAGAIGECIAEAVHKAWTSGHDPALPPFHVQVTFS